MTRPLPEWLARVAEVAIALLFGVAVGIAIAPMPKPLVQLTCPAPLLGSLTLGGGHA